MRLLIVVAPAVVGIGLLGTFGHAGVFGPLLQALGLQVPFSAAVAAAAAPFYVESAASAFRWVDADPLVVPVPGRVLRGRRGGTLSITPGGHRLKHPLDALIVEREDAAFRLHHRLTKWFDGAMRRVAGCYKRRVTLLILAIAPAVADASIASGSVYCLWLRLPF